MASRPASARSRKSASGAEQQQTQPQASSAKSRRTVHDDDVVRTGSAQSRGQLGGSQAWEANADNPTTSAAAEQLENSSNFGSQAAIMPANNGTDDEATGCWGKFKRGVRAVWMTKDTEDVSQNAELKIKTTLRELVMYCLFLVVICILTFGMTSSTMYYYTFVMNSLFLTTPTASGATFTSVKNFADWWGFAQGPLISGLYWDTWYNNANVTDPRERNFIYYENKLLGVPRMRQVRVRNDSCSIATDFRANIRACYAMYSRSAESREPFGYMNSTAWNYSTEQQLDGRGYSGKLATYNGGGYYIDLGRSREESTAKIDELFHGLWIDRATRAVFIDFTVYNANINLFCVIKLIAEFPATGGGFTSWEFRTVKLLRYVEPIDYFVLACECIFMLFICYYIVEEIIEIKRHKLAYFSSFWNWLDIVVIVIALVCAAFNIYRTISVGNKLTRLLEDETQYPDFDFLSFWQEQFNQAIAITVFFAWVKIFKYISFNKTMTQLSSTLGACAKDLLGFAVMFFIVFFAFAQLGYLIFGTKVEDFREFQQAIFTLFRIILGDFDFASLQNAHRVLGPIYFILYVFFVFFVLINMFLAIINDTYSEVKSNLANQPNDFEMTDYFKQRAGRVLDKLHLRRDKIVDIQRAMQSADMNNDRQLDFEEWRTELKMRGYADGEIEALFARYDMDGDRVLDEEEQRKMQWELEGQKAALNSQIESERAEQQRQGSAGVGADDGDADNDELAGDDRDGAVSLRGSMRSATRGGRPNTSGSNSGGGGSGVPIDEFTTLSRRVDRMEHSIGGIVNRIDSVLLKLESMERAKLKRRETMSRLLDSIGKCEGDSEAEKREKMERMVRQELERWGGAGEEETPPAAAAVESEHQLESASGRGSGSAASKQSNR
ncbi:hypothetical protein BOX15_Mlig009305g2 [Macrostomum lignano]|uniref:EF-hand domain-containing protein n=1 Tax=Macrostomum lignano TaxID=282301 RepID=A0A267E5C4_9PLAT|nr:hypothetical protein BOX15_Mlig009305g2 [Macrostomum lignano]